MEKQIVISTFTYNHSHLILYKESTINVFNCNTNTLSSSKSIFMHNKELDLDISQIEIYENTNVFFLLSRDRKRLFIWDIETNTISNLIMFEEDQVIRNYKLKNRLLIILFKNKVQIYSFKIEKNQVIYLRGQD